MITGGPCSGKSKTIERLAFLGYSIVPEAARILVDNEMSKMKTREQREQIVKQLRSDEAGFQDIVLKMKIDVEEKIPENRLTFFERGIPDSIAYYENCHLNPEPVRIASQKRRYKGVFHLSQLIYEIDYARVEDEKTAQDLSRRLLNSYSELGYDVVSVPPLSPIETRVDFIISKM